MILSVFDLTGEVVLKLLKVKKLQDIDDKVGDEKSEKNTTNKYLHNRGAKLH